MGTRCPTSEHLLRAALGAESPPLAERHSRECPRCARELDALREAVKAVRARSLVEEPLHDSCLDDFELAALVDGFDRVASLSAIEHLSSCGRCRGQLAAVARLVQHPSVALETAALAPPERRRHASRTARAALAAGLAAAALVGVALSPELLRNAAEGDEDLIVRERAITTVAAPQLLAPTGMATPADSLRWTSVPRADLYRVTVWDREGTVVWEGDARDTVLAFPAELARSPGASLLWDVKARTGLGRWVASELAELTVGDPRRNP